MNKTFTVLLILISLIFAVRTWAADADETSQMIVQAGSAIEYDVDGKEFVAQPNVKITYNGTTLTADKVEGYLDTGEVHASGHVVFKNKDRHLKSDQFVYNFKTGLGDATGASSDDNGIYFSGREMEIKPKTLTVLDSKFTGCDLSHPHYYLHAREIDITPGQQLVARRVSVVLLGHTLMTLPHLKMSLQPHRERKARTIPPIALSSKYGLLLGNEYDISHGKSVGSFAVSLSIRQLFETGLFYDKIGSTPFFGRATYRMPVYEGTRPGTLLTRAPEIGVRFAIGNDAHKLSTDRQSINLSTGGSDALPPWNSPGKFNLISEFGTGYYMEEPSRAESTRFDGRFAAWIDPIPLGSKTAISPGIIARFSHYGTGQNYSVYGFRVAMGTRFTPKTSLELSYDNLTVHGGTPFDFDRNELTEELDAKLRFPLAGLQLGFKPRYDLHSGELYDVEYSVGKTFHCITPTIGWRSRWHEFTLGVTLEGM